MTTFDKIKDMIVDQLDVEADEVTMDANIQGVCDDLAMLENALYSVISPRGAASILWKDASREQEACEIMRITAQDLLEFGVADAIIPEPEDGAQGDLDKMSQNIKEYLVKTIAVKSKKDIDILQKERYTKFRKIGVFSEPSHEVQKAAAGNENE